MTLSKIEVNCDLVGAYLKGRAILLKKPSLRSQEEREYVKRWLLERVSLISSLKLNEGELDFITEGLWLSTSLLLFCELSHAMHYITGDLDMLVENITLKLFAVNDVVYEQNEQVEK